MTDKIEKRGDRPLDYIFLLKTLETFKISFSTLTFAAMLFIDVVKEGINNSSYNPTTLAYNGDIFDIINKNIIDDNKIVKTELQKDILQVHIKELLVLVNNDYEAVFLFLGMNNSHFLRTKFINSIFEILSKYVLKYESLFKKDELRKNYLRTQLQKQDWYIILYILRNNASHADGIHTPFEKPRFLKDSKKTTFTWKTITVSIGMMSHSIRYNNEELLELYDEMVGYIVENHALFTRTNEGEKLFELIPNDFTM